MSPSDGRRFDSPSQRATGASSAPEDSALGPDGAPAPTGAGDCRIGCLLHDWTRLREESTIDQ